MHKDLHDELLFPFPDILNHFPNVSHVINVLEFRWSWQQFL